MLFLLRHSQAGPRGNYDELSALGVQQAQLLGAYFAQQNITFDAIYAGGLQRQQPHCNHRCRTAFKAGQNDYGCTVE